MNTVLTVSLLTVMLILMPLFVGLSFRRDKDAGIVLRYVTGMMILWCAVQVATLVMRFFSCDFAHAAIVLVVLIALTGVVMIVFFRDVIFYVNPRHMEFTPQMYVFLALLLVQVVTVLFAKPDVRFDMTAESVRTILKDDALFLHNPLTGDVLTDPPTLNTSVQVLPQFYAFLAYVSGAPVQVILYRVVPVFTLLLSYLVYGLLAHALFREDEKQALFLIAVSLLNIFGTFSDALLPFSLLRSGWQGDTVLFAVVLPFMLFVAVTPEKRSVLCGIVYLLLALTAAISVAGLSLGLGLASIFAVLWLVFAIWRWARG